MKFLERDRADPVSQAKKHTQQVAFACQFDLIAQLSLALPLSILGVNLPAAIAQTTAQTSPQNSPMAQIAAPDLPPLPPVRSLPPQDIIPRPQPSPPLPGIPPPPAPPSELLPNLPPSPPDAAPSNLPIQFRVTGFKFEGGTVFKDEELLSAIAESLKLDPATLLPREFTFAELLEARSAITKLYIAKGYITSGALIPAEQTIPPEGGVVRIQIVEGGLEEIKVTGTRRLQPGYISSRLAIATAKPLNRDRLLDALQLLSQSALIDKISAELAAGSRFGSNLLEVTVKEARTLHGELNLDNNRSPAVGSFRRGIRLYEDNLLGLGDQLSIGYTNTDGSNELDLNYTIPISPRDTTLQLSYNNTASSVIEKPFNLLDITSKSRTYALTLRHPLIRTVNQELGVGLTFSREETDTALGFEDIGPFPLSPGADANGRTRLSVLRLFQDYVQRNEKAVFALRSEFNLGLGILDATRNEIPPDGQFFAWRGQMQWVRLLTPRLPLVFRGNVQLADRPLVPLEQFTLGGQYSVRGYRQDALLADNGAFGSLEVRLPILHLPESNTLVQLVPFVDVGTVWNHSEDSKLPINTLVSTGLGLRVQVSDRLDFRFDWGIPLVSLNSSNQNTLQEQGFYFTFLWKLF